MKSLVMLVLLGICLLVPASVMAQAHNYWPTAVGNSRWYVEEDNADITCHMHIDGMVGDLSHFEREIYEGGEIIEYPTVTATTNQDGDVFFPGFGDGEQWYPFDPPYRWIDAPLYVGKIWEYETDNALLGHGVHYFEVLSEGWVTVPAGTFYCFEVLIDETFENWGQAIENHWFCDGIGTIRFTHAGHDSPFVLESYDAVASEMRSWSEVKSLYR